MHFVLQKSSHPSTTHPSHNPRLPFIRLIPFRPILSRHLIHRRRSFTHLSSSHLPLLHRPTPHPKPNNRTNHRRDPETNPHPPGSRDTVPSPSPSTPATHPCRRPWKYAVRRFCRFGSGRWDEILLGSGSETGYNSATLTLPHNRNPHSNRTHRRFRDHCFRYKWSEGGCWDWRGEEEEKRGRKPEEDVCEGCGWVQGGDAHYFVLPAAGEED